MIFLFKIGFLPIRIWDILDILIVGYLMYQLYKLLRGTIAFNIFIGVLTLYIIYWMVGQLQMELLSQVLKQFASVGVIVIVVIFQQEIRRFLLFLGNTALERQVEFVGRFFGHKEVLITNEREHQKAAVRVALQRMSRRKTGALIVLANGVNLEGIVSSGIHLDATISEPLLESIFNKESPLHDGAVIIAEGKIKSASCVLPISENATLPDTAGMRHRAAVGISEKANVAAFVVSEENGRISMSFRGRLEENLNEEQLKELLDKHFNE
ncbi:MAG: diadenylate cyclase CdaA [Saprospiraceae bacterium]|nr:diadenylate cyclase CdaA [Saprospiraceae bacterium]